MRTITTMLADELFESVNENNNKVMIDSRAREIRQHQSPVEILLSSLGACGAIDIAVMLKKRRKSIIHFEIITDGTRQEATPRFFTAIHCHYVITSPDVEQEEFQKAAGLSLEKYCSVASSLKSKVTYSVEVKRP
ncbi:MAG: OsmC family protein [Cyclobacteriaceae bacterium]|nr:OsmC family protein [Cyclobacteriaceae bacterium]